MKRFWHWYERNYVINVGIAAFLFVLQAVHLVWLAGDVVWPRLTGEALFAIGGVWKALLILVDYTEVPAIITVSLVYIHELRQGWKTKGFLYLIALNIQWLHLFWITDEFVVAAFADPVALPAALAWFAILIDYLEAPVIFATLARFFEAIKQKRAREFLIKNFRER